MITSPNARATPTVPSAPREWASATIAPQPANTSANAAIPSASARRARFGRGAGAMARIIPLTGDDSIDIHTSMAVDLELVPKQKRPAGEPCCAPVVYPDTERTEAERMATVAKALGDPTRPHPVDLRRKHAGKRSVCDLPPQCAVDRPPDS